MKKKGVKKIFVASLVAASSLFPLMRLKAADGTEVKASVDGNKVVIGNN